MCHIMSVDKVMTAIGDASNKKTFNKSKTHMKLLKDKYDKGGKDELQ